MGEFDPIAEGERLARPCVLLTRTSTAAGVAAVWRGRGVVPAPVGPYRHWLSVDCKFFPVGLGPLTGVLSVYTNEDDCVSGAAVHDSLATLPATADGALYAWPARSLPPPAAIPGGESAGYVSAWQADCPLYTQSAVAVLGGWHFPWPDGDWETLQERPLLVWTVAESEPWVEVWGGPSGFWVTQRIT